MTLIRIVAASVATPRPLLRLGTFVARVVVGLALVSLPTVACAVPVYTTDFNLTETVISEGGRWSNASSLWSNVQTSGGLAFGTQTGLEVSPNFNDSTALLSGFSPNVTLTAVVHLSPNISDGQTHEVELLFRMAQTTTTTRGYEMSFDTAGNVTLVRWNGDLGNYTFVNHTGGENPEVGGLKNGDVISATASGSTFTASVNGVRIYSATDSTFLTGQPGIGFFIRDSVTANAEFQSRYAFTSLTATDDTPLAPVPEPAAIGLVGVIMTLAGWYGARRTKRGPQLES